jgi:hypothetical protein
MLRSWLRLSKQHLRNHQDRLLLSQLQQLRGEIGLVGSEFAGCLDLAIRRWNDFCGMERYLIMNGQGYVHPIIPLAFAMMISQSPKICFKTGRRGSNLIE